MKAFILNLINDPYTIEQNFKPEDYDLVFIGFRMSIMDGFDLYNKLYEMSKKVQQDTSPLNDFRVCFMTTSRINYTTLAEIHDEFGEECYVCKENLKEIFFKTYLLFDNLNLFISIYMTQDIELSLSNLFLSVLYLILSLTLIANFT